MQITWWMESKYSLKHGDISIDHSKTVMSSWKLYARDRTISWCKTQTNTERERYWILPGQWPGECCVDGNISMCCLAQSEWRPQEPQPAIGSLTRDVLHLTAIQYLQCWSVITGSLKLCCCLELFHNFRCVEVFPASLSLAASESSL